jgi:hypothetical protein
MLIRIIAQLTHITINFDMSFTIQRKQTLYKTVTAVRNKRTGEQGVFWNECDNRNQWCIQSASPTVAYIICDMGKVTEHADHWEFEDLEVI